MTNVQENSNSPILGETPECAEAPEPRDVRQYKSDELQAVIEIFRLLIGWRNEARQKGLIDW